MMLKTNCLILLTYTALSAIENKIPDPSKYITTPVFNKLTAENLVQDQNKQI